MYINLKHDTDDTNAARPCCVCVKRFAYVCVCMCTIEVSTHARKDSVLQCAAVCCSVLQCDTVCCSVLQCVAVGVCVCVYVHNSSQYTRTYKKSVRGVCV